MINMLKNLKVLALIVAIIILIILFISQVTGGAEEITGNEQGTTTTTSVSLYQVNGDNLSNRINTSGTVESLLQASLTSEGTGSVRDVAVRIGDIVSRGDVLIRLSADDQLAALAQAEAGLQSQQARLNELKSGARPAELRNAQIALDEARQSFFNTDLRAYIANTDIYTNDSSYEAPEITGVYKAEREGSYQISLYRSGSNSGYSFRYTGIETGVSPVRTEIPQQLGDYGLYIQFPEDFATNRDLGWVVQIPNTRSLQYSQAQNSFARTQNNLELAQEGARSEQIHAQEAAVAQAQAGVAAAQSQLAKKTIRAPFSGEVTSVDVNTGEYVSPGQPVVEIIDADNIQVTTYISSGDAGSIKVGDTALLDGSYTGIVAAVASAVNSQTGKIEVAIEVVDQSTRLIVGDFISVEIFATNSKQLGVSVPLTAVKNDTEGAYVLQVNAENIAQRIDVVTGDVQGDSVVIIQGLLDVDMIIKDARSVNTGTAVNTN